LTSPYLAIAIPSMMVRNVLYLCRFTRTNAKRFHSAIKRYGLHGLHR
jgi:hypothetical protein